MSPQGTAWGPCAVGDFWGMKTALVMLKQSQLPGKHKESYQQFDTIRKLRTADFKEFQSSALAINSFGFVGERKKSYNLLNAPTTSEFFKKFIKGCKKRMGCFVMRDLALSMPILLKMLELYKKEIWDRAIGNQRKNMSVYLSDLHLTISPQHPISSMTM